MNNAKFDLKGRTALITGGAGILGRQHALALLESNAHVILSDNNDEMLDDALKCIRAYAPKGGISKILMDVTNEQSVRAVAETLSQQKQKVNILINNAAIDAKVTQKASVTNASRLEFFEVAEWDRQLSVGLTGAFICSKIFGHEMSLNGGGVILNIASDLSVIAPDQRLYSDPSIPENERATKPITYSVIKHGLVGLTRYLSTYWPEKNVRCNALSPGGVLFEQGKDFIVKVQDRIPLGRMASIDEYHSAVQFLCSDASEYMTGQNIVIDGGRSVW